MDRQESVRYDLSLYDADSGSGAVDASFVSKATADGYMLGSLAQYTQNGGNHTDAETDAFYEGLDAN